jgi:hypothetical protein
MLKSIRIKSGIRFLQISTACNPLTASSTPYPIDRRMCLRISRLSSESSTIKMKVISSVDTVVSQRNSAQFWAIRLIGGGAFCGKFQAWGRRQSGEGAYVKLNFSSKHRNSTAWLNESQEAISRMRSTLSGANALNVGKRVARTTLVLIIVEWLTGIGGAR